MDWIKVEISIPEHDFVKQIQLRGKKLCLIQHQQKLHVVQNNCPHAGGILSGGWCQVGHIVCPVHRYEYNLLTGRGATGQGDYIDIYPTLLKEDGLYVGIERSWWKRIFYKNKP